ncbi:MAG: formylmethanofuran dehydrogenase subunit C [Promethearchaeia archaeon]
MGEIKLKLKKEPEFPLEAECITPDNFAGNSIDEIKQLKVFHANQELTLGEFFEVSGDSEDEAESINIIVEGDLSDVKRIGEKMSTGEIEINGDVGMHVGNQMSGGKILVNGNADDWAGAMLKGGELEITGNAGNYVGAAYRGFWKGMEDGVIKVKGKIGNEALLWARSSKGKEQFPMLYCGGADSFLGAHNHGGTIIVDGDVNRYTGSDQARGIIIVKGKVNRMLPSYKKAGKAKSVELPNGEKVKGKFIEYSGDHATKKAANGRLYVAK